MQKEEKMVEKFSMPARCKSTIVTGLVAAALAFSMEVSELAGKVSAGTLLAFTMVAISVLILRYIPPDEVPLPPSLQEPIVSASTQYIWCSLEANEQDTKANVGASGSKKPSIVKEDESIDLSLIAKDPVIGKYIRVGNRRKVIGSARFALCGVGGTLLLSGFLFLSCMDQDDARHNYGHTAWGGYCAVARMGGPVDVASWGGGPKMRCAAGGGSRCCVGAGGGSEVAPGVWAVCGGWGEGARGGR
ncbi:hypothetical protein Fmac_021266 [Flemingia macrophylla]|uniref:Uncharacterized protein n=1 Tax=Flemingia macrophylla TaxID=520843 RepID=A0ABD1LWF3_9FABA